jgi:ubiquinone/menaquinone biosynthesis C-methylase UbiE
MVRMNELFFEVHRDNPREGPGSNEATQRAYEAMKGLPEEPVILEIGCGPGMQTIHLAKISGGEISATDNHAPFLDVLKAAAEAEGLEYRIDTVEASMFDLLFEEGIFDIVWSEGAIYIAGFENGLRDWKRFLRRTGYVAVTELSWLKSDPPAELSEFWAAGYPAMKSVEQNIEIIKRCGYEPIEHFTLPESAWWDNYYNPIRKRLVSLREKYRGDSEAETVFAAVETEMSMFERYSDWYGYVFFVMKKTG